MATDIIPTKDRIQNESENFALNSNSKIVRRVEDEAAILVLNQILVGLGGSSGLAFNKQAQTVTTPNVAQELINETVAVGKTLNLKRVIVSCRRQLSYIVLIDAVTVGSGRVGSGNLDSNFVFDVDMLAVAGQVVRVIVTANSGPATDVEAYLQALET